MLSKLSNFLNNLASGRNTVIALLLLLAYLAIVFPYQTSYTDQHLNGLGLPDTNLTYSSQNLLDIANHYGAEGRLAYIISAFTFDVAWPIAYGSFLLLTVSWFTKKVTLPIPFWKTANLIPAAGLFFDFLENSSISIVLARYPNSSFPLSTLAGLFTLAKWIFLTASVLLILLGMIKLTLVRGSNNSPT